MFIDFSVPGDRDANPWPLRIPGNVVASAVFNSPAGFDQRPVDVLSFHCPPPFILIISRNITYVNACSRCVRALKGIDLPLDVLGLGCYNNDGRGN